MENAIGISIYIISPTVVIIIDEPTNHLDLHAVVWLGQYLNDGQQRGCISHDSSFLNEVCTDIVEMRNKCLLL